MKGKLFLIKRGNSLDLTNEVDDIGKDRCTYEVGGQTYLAERYNIFRFSSGDGTLDDLITYYYSAKYNPFGNRASVFENGWFVHNREASEVNQDTEFFLRMIIFSLRGK